MILDIAFLTDVGLKRKLNEDAILVDRETATFIVADGMGGHEKGEVASKILIDAFSLSSLDHLPSNLDSDEDTIVPSTCIDDALNQRIEVATNNMIQYAQDQNINSTIGSTIVGLKYVKNIRAWALFHLGDSRAYMFRQNSLTQLTVDHSKYEMLKQKNLSDEEIAKSGKNIITKAVGNFKSYSLEIQYISPRKDDIYLLCSDGVSGLCTNDELLRLIIQYKDNLNFLCMQIKSLVYSRGANDNLSMIAIKI